MTLKSMGLWLAPHEVDPSRVKQVNAVAREAAALCPDAILFPEGWLIIHPQDADLVDEIVAEVTQPLRENGTRCFVGVEVRGRQLLMDAAEPSVPYMKHSSAGHVAFQEEQWSAQRNLPVWRAEIGPMICHDMYLSLLAHQLRARGAHLYVNPSGGGVVEKKWARVLQGRALEAAAPVACTMSDMGQGATACWVMGPTGGPLTLRTSDGERVRVGRRAGRLYVTDVTEVGEPDPFSVGRPAGGVEGVAVSITGDCLHIGREWAIWEAEERIGGFHLISLAGGDLLDPCRWVEPLLRYRDRCIYWLRASRSRRAEALAIAQAKAVELCCPSIVETEGCGTVVVELYNKSKGVRINDPPTLMAGMQFGYQSAFKMLRGVEEPQCAWKVHVKQYETLLESCRQ